MFVKPRAGVQVRDPVSKLHLPAEGKAVPDGDPYWHRRLRSGDVELTTAEALSGTAVKTSAAKGKE